MKKCTTDRRIFCPDFSFLLSSILHLQFLYFSWLVKILIDTFFNCQVHLLKWFQSSHSHQFFWQKCISNDLRNSLIDPNCAIIHSVYFSRNISDFYFRKKKFFLIFPSVCKKFHKLYFYLTFIMQDYDMQLKTIWLLQRTLRIPWPYYEAFQCTRRCWQCSKFNSFFMHNV